VYNPSWFVPNKSPDVSPPDSELMLEYIHGYSGETGRQDRPSWSTNVMWLRTGELVFPASAVVILHDFERNRQRFFMGHDEDVMAIAVYAHKDIVASGQAGGEAVVCVFDASLSLPGAHDSEEQAASKSSIVEPEFICELLVGSKESKGVAALDFSSDGKLLLAMAAGDDHALSVWDWRRGSRLAVHKAQSVHQGSYLIRFNPYLHLTGQRATKVGLGPGEACYTMVSCGCKHVKFWTLTCTQTLPEMGGLEDSAGEGGGGSANRKNECWAWVLEGKPGSFGRRAVVEDMVCMTFISGLHGVRAVTGGQDLLPLSRTVTGGQNGQIYFWETPEEESGIGWIPYGRLLAVVPRAHEGPVTDMCFLPVPMGRERSRGGKGGEIERETGTGGGSAFLGQLATCGGEGTLRLWRVTTKGPAPLERLSSVDISSRGAGVGHPRSVCWDRSGTTLALGTVGNAVCLVQPGEVSRPSFMD
ncbi:unnamed protein product, partial [Choristocarpus tenellus]